MSNSEIRLELNLASPKRWLSNLLPNLFGIDYRAIKVFRISLGFLILTDLLLKLPYVEAFFTDKGILPRSLFLTYQDVGRVSIHVANGELWWQLALFAIAAIFACMLILNIRPRIAAAASLFLLVSLQARNPLLLQGGDVLFRCLLFWLIFLPHSQPPLRVRGGGRQDGGVTSVATAGVLIQVALLFIFAGLLKTGAPWTTTLTATWDAMQIKMLTTPIGDFIASLGALTKLPTFIVPPLEFWGGLLLFFPLFTKYVRTLLFVLLAGLLINFGLALQIDLFPPIVITGLLLFLPSFVWDFLERQFGRFINRFNLRKGFSLLTDLQQRFPNPEIKSTPFVRYVTSVFLATVIMLTVWWNIASIPGYTGYAFPQIATPFMMKTGLDQYWGMFAPYPVNVHGTFVLAGQLPGGTVVDVLSRRVGELDWDQDNWFGGQPWRKYAVDYLSRSSHSYLLNPFASLVCRKWRESTDQPLSKLTIYFVEVNTLPDFKLSEPVRKTLWTGNCV